jgi:hypothetical protein
LKIREQSYSFFLKSERKIAEKVPKWFVFCYFMSKICQLMNFRPHFTDIRPLFQKKELPLHHQRKEIFLMVKVYG